MSSALGTTVGLMQAWTEGLLVDDLLSPKSQRALRKYCTRHYTSSKRLIQIGDQVARIF